MTQVTEVTVIRLLIQADEYISIVAHRFHRMVTNAYLKQTRAAEDFGREGAEGIHIIPPTGSSQGKNITTRDGALARLTADANCYFILHRMIPLQIIDRATLLLNMTRPLVSDVSVIRSICISCR